jgi:hypothetical protein
MGPVNKTMLMSMLMIGMLTGGGGTHTTLAARGLGSSRWSAGGRGLASRSGHVVGEVVGRREVVRGGGQGAEEGPLEGRLEAVDGNNTVINREHILVAIVWVLPTKQEECKYINNCNINCSYHR